MKQVFRHLTEHAHRFFLLESAGGIVMIAFAALAIALANSPLSEGYGALISAPLFADFYVSSFTKDVLMVIFFFAIGMELKLEMREGALSAKGQKILPLIAAIGGIAVPALLYITITRNHPELHAGWAIPTATDIAFAMCVLRLIGPSIPAPAKIFLLAIAIYDDLAAILIIAIFYSSSLALLPLLAVAGLAGALYAMNRTNVTRILPYLLIGIALWFALHAAGIHTTVAGVMVGIAIPCVAAMAQHFSAIRSMPSTPMSRLPFCPSSPSPAPGLIYAISRSTKPSPRCRWVSPSPYFLANKSAFLGPRSLPSNLGWRPCPNMSTGRWFTASPSSPESASP